MSAQMTHANIEHNPDNFLVLKHRPIFTIALYASKPQEIDGCAFIANGRLVSSGEVEVWILDGSELADCVRTQSGLYFEVDVLDGSVLRGFARANIGESRMGMHDRRYVETRLLLERADVEALEIAPVKWLT